MAISRQYGWRAAATSLLATLSALTGATCAQAQTQLAFITPGEIADAPAGFVAMCQRDKVLCAAGLPLDTPQQIPAIAEPRLITLEAENAITAWKNILPISLDMAPAMPFMSTSLQADHWSDEAKGGSGIFTEIAMGPTGFITACLHDKTPCATDLSPETALTIQIASKPNLAPFEVENPISSLGDMSQIALTETSIQTPAAPAAQNSSVASFNSRDAWKQIKDINRWVNQHVAQAPDLATYGQDDYWARPNKLKPAGDCEDIAIEKRMRLIESGFPPDRLRFAVVYKQEFGLHVVLVAHLDEEDIVLDSATYQLRPWHEAGYVWLRLQSAKNPMEWHTVAKPGETNIGTTLIAANDAPAYQAAGDHPMTNRTLAQK